MNVNSVRTFWARIQEPRSVSIAYFVVYFSGVVVGGYATVRPPTSLEGEIGSTAMIVLTILLTFGCVLGSIAVLPGIYWLERSAVTSISLAAALYLAIVLTLHVTQPGNRSVQAWFVGFVLAMQWVRWVRIRDRPYRPDPPHQIADA